MKRSEARELTPGQVKELLDGVRALRTAASKASNATDGVAAMAHRAQLAAYDRCLAKIQRLLGAG